MRSLLLFLAIALGCSAQEVAPSLVTGMYVNGAYWRDASVREKVAYLAGFHDAYLSALTKPDSSKSPSDMRWAVGVGMEQYVTEINAVYADKDNLPIPIPFVFDYCTYKLQKKITTREGLKKALIDLRNLSVSMTRAGPDSPQPPPQIAPEAPRLPAR